MSLPIHSLSLRSRHMKIYVIFHVYIPYSCIIWATIEQNCADKRLNIAIACFIRRFRRIFLNRNMLNYLSISIIGKAQRSRQKDDRSIRLEPTSCNELRSRQPFIHQIGHHQRSSTSNVSRIIDWTTRLRVLALPKPETNKKNKQAELKSKTASAQTNRLSLFPSSFRTSPRFYHDLYSLHTNPKDKQGRKMDKRGSWIRDRIEQDWKMNNEGN